MWRQGAGLEKHSKMVMLKPVDLDVDWYVKPYRPWCRWCPPGNAGIGIAVTAEKAAVPGQESLRTSIDIHELANVARQNRVIECVWRFMGTSQARWGNVARVWAGLTTRC